MRHLLGISIGGIAALVVGEAIAITPDLGLDFSYPSVGMCGGGSATAISAKSAITAKHVPGLQIELLGTIYTATQRINHPTYDIAILNFSTDLPVWSPLGALAPVGTTVQWVGYGGVGYVNQQQNGYDIRYGNHGRHKASNVIHKKWSMFGLGPAMVSMLEGNPNAAGVNGDSGGACFVNGKLVGVISYAFNEKSGQLPNYGFAVLNNGVPYHGTGAIDLTVPEIRAWVRRNMKPTIYQIGPQASPRPATYLDRLPPIPLPFFTTGR
jgi:hypothetical protein